MADTQSHTPGVIKSTRDYLAVVQSPAPVSPAPASPDDSEDAHVPSPISTISGDDESSTISTSRDNPREIRNRNEKMRRDRLNQSVAELAAMVPPVVAARRKIDKTTVLRLTAHYLRAHQYVFGDSIGQSGHDFSSASTMKVLGLFNGFLLTVTYRGIIVVVSHNITQYLGYTELDLLGQNLLTITHEDDRVTLRDQLMPKTQKLGPNGELLIPDEPGARAEVEEALAREKRNFVIRFKKLGQRSEPSQYLTCHVEGSLRKADRANGGLSRCCPIVRRVRARTENPCSSGNDIVFIGVVRPTTETFINESALEGYRMEYRTRHSIDGQIIQCEARIALVTGYMTHEVSGVNAMNFMHRDDVRWVIIALREMYDQQKMYGESCYRLMTKNGQFIYMKTRGHLVVDQDSRACTSFVCTNTVVDEREGKHLIRLMRKKFALLINNNEAKAIEAADKEIKDEEDNKTVAVENPRRLEGVILTLVTNLPSPAIDIDNESRSTPEKSMSPNHRIAIIPPAKEKIVGAIEKIYDVIKTLNKEQDVKIVEEENSNNAVAGKYMAPPPVISNKRFGRTSEENRVVDFKPKKNTDVFNFGQASNASLQYSSTSVIRRGSKAKVEPEQSAAMPDIDNNPDGYSNISAFFENFKDSAPDTENVMQEFNSEFLVMDPQMNYFPVAKLPEESSTGQMLPTASTSNYLSGIKRPGDFEVEDFTFKKKLTDVASNDAISGLESPTLENFFDESLFNSQIETAMNSLDSIDPTFPDLLVSSDVQDFLGQLEKEQQQEELPDFV